MSQSPPKTMKPSTPCPIATNASPADCIVHNVIQNHRGELNKILREAKDVNKRPPPPVDFRQIPICRIGHPGALTSYTLESSEMKYIQDYPEWETEAKAVPPNDLHFDKLITTRTPYIRALDIEELFADLQNRIPNVQMTNFDGMPDDDVIDLCVDNIWITLEHIINSPKMSFKNQDKLKEKIMREIKIQCGSVIVDIKNAITQQQTIIDIQREMAKRMILESTTWGYYTNRCGGMGEIVVKQFIHKLLEEKIIPSLTLSGFRISKYLGENLARVGITLPQDAEMDVATFIPNGDHINVNFVQTKVLFPSDNEANNEEKLIEKVKYSLLQTRKDLKALLTIMPDVMGTELDKMKFGTFSALPITPRSNKICDTCSEFILFTDDLHDTSATQDQDQESIAKTIVGVLESQSAASSQGLGSKFDLDDISRPTSESLHLFKKLSSRYIGVSSVHPMKDYSAFHGKQEKQLKDLDKFTKKDPERTLYLTPSQYKALNNYEFALVGPYGSGKTTVLEMSLQNILDDPEFKDQPCQIIIVVGSEKSYTTGNLDLLKRFKDFSEEYEGVHSVKAFSVKEIFAEFGLEYDFKNALTCWNNLLKEISEAFPQTAIGEIFLLVDEMRPIVKQDGALENYFDWSGMDTRGIKLLLSLQPIVDAAGTTHPVEEVKFPLHIPIIRLNRVLRCTQSILNLINGFIKVSKIDFDMDTNEDPTLSMHVLFEMDAVTPGHEIQGEIPEYVSVPPCKCLEEGCEFLVEHFLSPNFPILEAILNSMVVSDEIPQSHITVLLRSPGVNDECFSWLVQQVQNRYKDVLVKEKDEFIGMESPVLIFINDGYWSDHVLESMTRVSSRLIVINKEWAIQDVIQTLFFQKMCEQGLMKDATDKYKSLIQECG